MVAGKALETAVLWTLKDVAKFLSLQPETIRKMVGAGRITRADGVVKVGRMTRFKRAVVIARLFAKGLVEDGRMAGAAPERKLRAL